MPSSNLILQLFNRRKFITPCYLIHSINFNLISNYYSMICPFLLFSCYHVAATEQSLAITAAIVASVVAGVTGLGIVGLVVGLLILIMLGFK